MKQRKTTTNGSTIGNVLIIKFRILDKKLSFMSAAQIDTNKAGHVPAVEAKATGGTSRHCKPLAVESFSQWIKFKCQD
jgi:hypothetical protein